MIMVRLLRSSRFRIRVHAGRLAWGMLGATLLSLQAAEPPPNIIWIIGEDMRADLGCWGVDVRCLMPPKR